MNCNSKQLLKVQLLLQELFILAVNVYMYGTVNVHEFIFSASMTSVESVSHNRSPFKNRLAHKNGALIRIGALINKNTFKGGRLFGEGRLLEGGRLIKSLRYVP